MSSVAENDKEPIILTGPNADALQDFENTLAHVAPEISSQHRELRKLIGKQLIEEHLDFSHVKCFLVMPRASRTLVYLEGDRSSMYQELKHMCATKNDEWNNITRVIIVLYRNEEVAQSDALYDCQKINLWWDPGPQRELQQFANINHLISFRSKLNIEQTNVIRKFLGYKPKQQEKKQKQRNNKVDRKRMSLSRHQIVLLLAVVCIIGIYLLATLLRLVRFSTLTNIKLPTNAGMPLNAETGVPINDERKIATNGTKKMPVNVGKEVSVDARREVRAPLVDPTGGVLMKESATKHYKGRKKFKRRISM